MACVFGALYLDPMGIILRYIHDQVMGGLRAGKERDSAETALDRGASKAFAVALGILALCFAILPLALDFLPPLLDLKALVVAMMTFGLAVRYWQGTSVFAMLKSMARNWIPTGMLIYIFFVLYKMAVVLFKQGRTEDVAFHGGIMMMLMAFLGLVTSWIHANVLRDQAKEEVTSKAVPILALRFYALVWVAFFCGGAFMLAWATGLADWFMVDVLGL